MAFLLRPDGESKNRTSTSGPAALRFPGGRGLTGCRSRLRRSTEEGRGKSRSVTLAGAEPDVRFDLAHAFGVLGDTDRLVALELGGDLSGEEDDALTGIDVDLRVLDDRIAVEALLHL